MTGPAKFLDGHVYALVKWQGRAATLEARSGFPRSHVSRSEASLVVLGVLLSVGGVLSLIF